MNHYAMKTYGGVDVEIHDFVTSVIVDDDWRCSVDFPVQKNKGRPL
jgi:hypothetical protein